MIGVFKLSESLSLMRVFRGPVESTTDPFKDYTFSTVRNPLRGFEKHGLSIFFSPCR